MSAESKVAHTATPWKAETDERVPERGAVYIEGPRGWFNQPVACCDVSYEGAALDEANAAHIVLCVNSHEAMREALEKIAAPHACGCKPCTGQCVSQEALRITVDAMRDIADAALVLAKGK